jgi:hypothetical protein
MSKRVFDESFKKAAIDLSNSRGAIKGVEGCPNRTRYIKIANKVDI